MSRGRSLAAIAAVASLALAVGGSPSLGAAGTPEIVFAANDAPATSGEIYVITAGGRQIDLTKSPALDDGPAVSPDGKTVAFLSLRAGRLAAYTVRIDGSGLRRISPFFGQMAHPGSFSTASITWSPSGRRLAVQLFNLTTGHVYVVDANGDGWHAVSPPQQLVINAASWSPDGTELLYAFGARARNGVRVVSTEGGKSWSVPGNSASWSAGGRLAVETSKTRFAIYDRSGRRLGVVPATWAAWSPVGDDLATLTSSGGLSIRAGGTGPARSLGTFDVGLQNQDESTLEWIGGSTVAVADGIDWQPIDARTGRRVALPHLFTEGANVVSTNGAEAAGAEPGTTTSTLEIQERSATSPTVVQTHPTCGFDSPYDDIQLVPGSHSLVYESGCFDPPGGLFAIDPDGSALHRLTDPSLDANQPALSPDGSTLAFVHRASSTCFTCADEIWLAHADGSDPHQFVASPPKLGALFDDSPSFSPDGSEILFAQSSGPPGGLALFPNDSKLFEAPIASGQANPLALAGSSPQWGPRLIAYTNGKGQLAVAHPDGTVPTPLAAGGESISGTAAWSSDGRLAVLGSSGAAAWIAVSGSRTITLPRLQLETSGGGLAWSPDGTQLAFIAADDEGIGDVWVVNVDGTGLHRLTHDVGASLGITWR